MLHSFALNEESNIKEYYYENGYVVVRNVITNEQILSFMEIYEAFKSLSSYCYRSQDTNRVEQVKVDDHGFLEHSILNPTKLIFQKKISNAVSNIIYSPSVTQLLAELSGCSRHYVRQTMFFDKTTGTVPHQDHYYLDSEPPGKLVACWYALETIEADAGPFFVVPKSHRGPLIERGANRSRFDDHEEYVRKIQNLIQTEKYEPKPMLLEKGSILFWHPFLVHGAFQLTNPNHSRKSFTAHFVPETFEKKGVFNVVSKENDTILLRQQSLKDQFREYLRYGRSWVEVKFRNENKLPEMEMRSSQY
jgi:phytanoyl-CoA hydroxylase